MNELENYYGKFCEDKRLLRKHGQVEYRTSMKYIHDYFFNSLSAEIIQCAEDSSALDNRLLDIRKQILELK